MVDTESESNDAIDLDRLLLTALLPASGSSSSSGRLPLSCSVFSLRFDSVSPFLKEP